MDAGYGPIKNLCAELKHYFTSTGNGDLKKIDRGTPILQWPLSGPPKRVLAGDQNDGSLSNPELMQEAFLRLETISFGRKEFKAELCPQKNNTNFLCFFAGKSPSLPPWIIDDADPKTHKDTELRERIDLIVKNARHTLEAKGLKPNTLSYNDALVRLLLASIQTPLSQGGLGVSKVGTEIQRYFDAVTAYTQQKGACHAHSFLFYALAKRAGLSPQFIRYSGLYEKKTGRVKEILHIAVALPLDPDKPDQLTAVDPSYKQIIANKKDQWYPITRLEMAAYHLRNIAIYTEKGAQSETDFLAWQESLLKQALYLAPNDFEILWDLAWFYRFRAKNPALYDHYRTRAYQLNPSFDTIW